MDLASLTLRKFHDGLRAGTFSAREIVDEYYRAIDAKDGALHSYLSTNRDAARAAADAADALIAVKKHAPPLAGAPIAIKDNICIAGEPTTAASKILKRYRAVYDATIVKKLRCEGAVVLGKTNLDEFAMGSSTENSAFGSVKNPHDPSRVPGGSSGGSAAAVAANMALAALGSDTGGSIRQPAGFCGVVGLKPTYGAVSRYGLIAMASSLDQIGPIAKTVEDAALLFRAILGPDPHDATAADVAYGGDFIEKPREEIKKMTIGIPKEYFSSNSSAESGLDPEVAEAMNSARHNLERVGVTFKELSLPHTKYALSVYYIIQPAEVSSNLARFDGIRYERITNRHESSITNAYKLKLKDIYFETKSAGFGPEVKRRIMLGTFVLSSGYYDAYYAKAQKVRRIITDEMVKALDPKQGGVDAIFAPTSPTVPFKFGEKTANPLAMYLADVFTIPANLAGLPAISIPVRSRVKDALPIGFQLIGRHWSERDILSLGHRYEKLFE